MRHRYYVGRVVSDKMDKTVVVVVEWTQTHPLYRKTVRRRTKFYAHDPRNECRVGDTVRIVEVRPLSRTKRWLVKEILARAEQVGVPPEEVDRPLLEGGETPEAAAPRQQNGDTQEGAQG